MSIFDQWLLWSGSRPAVQTWSRGCQALVRKKHWTRWQQAWARNYQSWRCRRYGTVRHYTSHWRSLMQSMSHLRHYTRRSLNAVHVTSRCMYMFALCNCSRTHTDILTWCYIVGYSFASAHPNYSNRISTVHRVCVLRTLVCVLIDVDHSKFEPRNVSHRGAARRRAHRGCNIACEHFSATSIRSFLHRWQPINLHEQSWRRTFHTT